MRRIPHRHMVRFPTDRTGDWSNSSSKTNRAASAERPPQWFSSGCRLPAHLHLQEALEAGQVLPSSELLRQASLRPEPLRTDGTVGMHHSLLSEPYGYRQQVESDLLNTHEKKKSPKDYQKQNKTEITTCRETVLPWGRGLFPTVSLLYSIYSQVSKKTACFPR